MLKDSFKNTILFSILFFLFFYSFSKGVSSEEDRDFYTYDEIEKMCNYLTQLAPNHIMNKNIEYKKEVITSIHNQQHNYYVKANWITAIIFKESSFKKSLTDKKGAFGLMQVHPYIIKKFKCENMDTTNGQIECGTKFFRYCITMCSSYKGGFSGYASINMKCIPQRNTKLNWVVNQREKLAIELDSIL